MTDDPRVELRTESRIESFRFPPDFLWGAATSAHQVEGDNTNNDWWAWEQAGRVATPSGLAADHYRRFREDFDIARELRHNAHRFSVEWSRVEPEEGRFSEGALAHYGEVVDALIERRIEPIVTLLHFTLPQWLSAQGGWECERFELLFERFVRRVVTEYGARVRWWITINEPVVQLFKGYVIGQWPPGKQDHATAFRVLARMLRTHARCYRAIHELYPRAKVGLAKHAISSSPCDPDSWFDRMSVRVREYIFNDVFLDAIHRGSLLIPGIMWERLPAAHTLDFVGLNYYTRDFVKNTGFDVPGLIGNMCSLETYQHVAKRNDLGWEIYPEGFGHFLRRFARHGLPVLVTENGTAARDDSNRHTFLLLHLWELMRASAEGIPILGYLHWSLLDNFEWADGYSAKFGLVEVDMKTQERRVRESGRWLGEVIRRRGL